MSEEAEQVRYRCVLCGAELQAQAVEQERADAIRDGRLRPNQLMLVLCDQCTAQDVP